MLLMNTFKDASTPVRMGFWGQILGITIGAAAAGPNGAAIGGLIAPFAGAALGKMIDGSKASPSTTLSRRKAPQRRP